jgi:hypothetical protein
MRQCILFGKRNIQSGDFQASVFRSRDANAQIQDECIMSDVCNGTAQDMTSWSQEFIVILVRKSVIHFHVFWWWLAMHRVATAWVV